MRFRYISKKQRFGDIVETISIIYPIKLNYLLIEWFIIIIIIIIIICTFWNHKQSFFLLLYIKY